MQYMLLNYNLITYSYIIKMFKGLSRHIITLKPETFNATTISEMSSFYKKKMCPLSSYLPIKRHVANRFS